MSTDAAATNPFDVLAIQVSFPSYYLNSEDSRPTVSLQNAHATADSSSTSITLPPLTGIKSETLGGTCRGVLKGVKFVLKYALDTGRFPVNCSMLEEEERIYATYLKNLQGSVVPRIYGYFKGTAKAKFPVACLIMEDCGDAVTVRFDKLPLKDR